MTENQFREPGHRVHHAEYGDGVTISAASDEFIRVFFGSGERQVPVASLSQAIGRSEKIIKSVGQGERRNRRAWLSYQAHALPLLESASALTSAKIDLLPHQVVLTHRIATSSPRRFLIARTAAAGPLVPSSQRKSRPEGVT